MFVWKRCPGRRIEGDELDRRVRLRERLELEPEPLFEPATSFALMWERSPKLRHSFGSAREKAGVSTARTAKPSGMATVAEVGAAPASRRARRDRGGTGDVGARRPSL
jgi:hypothetical protein